MATPFKQVCAQLGDLRTLKTWHCPHLLLCAVLLRRRPCSNRSISPTRRAHSSKHAARCCSGRMGQTDRRTHGRTPYRFMDPAPHTMQPVQTKVKKSHSDIAIFSMNDSLVSKYGKFSHTRYRALGPELIPVYRQSARR